MAIHRVAFRAGVVAAVVAGLLTGVAPAAYADHDLRLANVGNVELRVGGGAQSIQLRVENPDNHNNPVEDGVAQGVQLTMTVPLAAEGVHIATAPNGCNLANDNTRIDCALPDIAPGSSWSGVAQIAVQGNSTVTSGETRDGDAQVFLSTGGQTRFRVRVQGPDRPPGVAEVSGLVTDVSTGEGIEGATVTMADSQEQTFQATTNGEGRFRFTDDNIAPGTLALRASKDGYEAQPDPSTATGQAGESVGDIQLALRNTASPTPSQTPSQSPTPTASDSPTVAAAAEPASSSGGGFFTTLLVILGILFVLLGVGAIALLIYRRRKEQREDDEGPEGAGGPISGPPGPRPTPGSHGVYRPAETQVMGPGGRPVPAVGPQPALANAQTMMQARAGAADETTMLPRAGDSASTAMMPHAGDAAGTAMMPRAGEPPPTSPGRPMGPRPPVAGSPPPPRPAAPTYGGAQAPGYEDPRGRHAGPPDGYGGGYDNPTQAGGPAQAYGTPTQPYSGGAQPYSGATPGYGGDPAYGDPAYGGAPGYGGDRGYGAGGRDGGGSGYGSPAGSGYTPSYDSSTSYGPDPYAQPAQTSGGGYDHGYQRGSAYDAGGYGGGGYDHGGGGYRGAGYDAGAGGYDPAAGYGGPSAGYGAPSAGHGAPADGYGGPSAGYGAPSAGHGAPADGYGGPSAGYGGPSAGYGAPSAGHGVPPGQAPGAGPAPEPPGYPADYRDEPGTPRPRHADPERRRLDWLDN